MKVPFNDFKAHYAAVAQVVEPAVQRVLESGWYVLGGEVEALEAELAEYLGVPYCVGVASGTDAITLALLAAGIGSGDDVITTAMTAYPTITGIKRAGATPVVADIDAESGLLDPAAVARAITPRTRALVPVHLYGQCCDMESLMALAEEHDLVVIEDCAQAIGASWGERQAGTIGLAGAYSFYPTKNLGAFGDGGAVATGDPQIHERLRSLRNYGQTDRYHHEFDGLNSRLDEVQAAVLRAKLPLLEEATRRRRAIAQRYRQSLTQVAPVVEHSRGRHVYHLFPVRTVERDPLMAHLKAAGIGSLIHYPIPIHRQGDFARDATSIPACPVAEQWAEQVLSLPVYPELTDEQVTAVIDAVQSFTS